MDCTACFALHSIGIGNPRLANPCHDGARTTPGLPNYEQSRANALLKWSKSVGIGIRKPRELRLKPDIYSSGLFRVISSILIRTVGLRFIHERPQRVDGR
jgi:hypothetical protein